MSFDRDSLLSPRSHRGHERVETSRADSTWTIPSPRITEAKVKELAGESMCNHQSLHCLTCLMSFRIFCHIFLVCPLIVSYQHQRRCFIVSYSRCWLTRIPIVNARDNAKSLVASSERLFALFEPATFVFDLSFNDQMLHARTY